jgi:hypothetical protein
LVKIHKKIVNHCSLWMRAYIGRGESINMSCTLFRKYVSHLSLNVSWNCLKFDGWCSCRVSRDNFQTIGGAFVYACHTSLYMSLFRWTSILKHVTFYLRHKSSMKPLDLKKNDLMHGGATLCIFRESMCRVIIWWYQTTGLVPRKKNGLVIFQLPGIGFGMYSADSCGRHTLYNSIPIPKL